MPRAPQAPPPGVVRNGTAEATPGRWFDTNNIRFRGGLIQPVGGNSEVPGSSTPDPIRDLLTWHDNAGVRWAALGTDTKLYAYRFDTAVLYDITPAGVGPLEPPGPRVGYGLGDFGVSTFGTARDPSDIGAQDIAANMGDRWSMDTFGQDLLVVPTQDGHLFHWTPTAPATVAAVISAAPIGNKGVFVTDQRHVGLIGADADPRKVRWSDQEDYTSWTATAANMAGDKMLQTQSYAMATVKVSQGILIFTANDLHMMTYVGPPYAYGISQIASGCGLASLRAPVAIGSIVMWPGAQTFWQWAGSVQPVMCDVGDWFFSLMNRAYIGRIFGSPNPAFSEMWWDWPDEGSTECNRYLALNYSDQRRPWTIGVRTRTAADPTGTMDYPILGGPDPLVSGGGMLFLHEYGWTDNGNARASAGTVYAQSGAIVLGEGDTRFAVKQIVLDSADTAANMVGYRFIVRENPHDAASEFDTGLFTVEHDGLMDVSFSGRTMQMRLEATVDGDFTVGRPRLQMRPAGKR
jgi:hypothetical protein